MTAGFLWSSKNCCQKVLFFSHLVELMYWEGRAFSNMVAFNLILEHFSCWLSGWYDACVFNEGSLPFKRVCFLSTRTESLPRHESIPWREVGHLRALLTNFLSCVNLAADTISLTEPAYSKKSFLSSI